MLIGVMSDSHDNLPKIEAAVSLFNAWRVGLVLHAGDFIAPFTASPLGTLECRLVGVFGNNDGEKRFLREKYAPFADLHDGGTHLQVEDRSICLVHEPYLLEVLVTCSHLDLIVYGHTHKVDICQDGTLVLNPGEVGGWVTGRSTVAIVDLSDMQVEIIDL